MDVHLHLHVCMIMSLSFPPQSETDDLAMRKVADVMHILFATHGSTLLPIFEQMLPILVEMLQEEHPSSHKQWALCMFDDLLEFASQVWIVHPTVFAHYTSTVV